RVEVHARVGTGLGHDVALPFEVFEICLVYGTGVIQVAYLAVGNNIAIDDGERIRVIFGDLPALKILPIEQTVPTVGIGFGRFPLRFGSSGGNLAGYND